MEHQYPGAISPDENMLAELMLPDQTHMRAQDWTMFFLHKDGAAADDEEFEQQKKQAREQRQLARESRRSAATDEQEEDTLDEETDDESDEAAPLMYVLNLVYTKHDANEKRGAKTQAMAICTRHSFLDIYKPLLLLALEDYFKTPSESILERLYHSLNAMDLSLMPRFTSLERSLLQANDVRDLLVEKFEAMIEQRTEEESRQSPPKRSKYTVPRNTHEFESRITYNDIPIPVKIPTAPSHETVGSFSIVQLVQTFHAQHALSPQPFTLHPHLTTAGAYTHPIIVLINAMLTEKRVVFLGHNRPSGEVAEAVLAACALASGGILRGFTRHAFPYTDLSKIDELLKVPGFTAGVTNPAFLYHPEWWDLLVDLPAGRMKISPSIAPAPVNEGTTYFAQHHNPVIRQDPTHDSTADQVFMDSVLSAIDNRQGEHIIRSKFRSYIFKFTRIAAAFEETVYGASSLVVLPASELSGSSPLHPRKSTAGIPGVSKAIKGHGYVWPSEGDKTRELAATASRIEGWRNTRSYYNFISDLATRVPVPVEPRINNESESLSMAEMLASEKAIEVSSQKRYLDIYHSLSKLRTLRLTSSEAAPIFLALATYCSTYRTILELLVQAPLAEAGLFYVSLGLWHEQKSVREATTRLLERVRQHPAGRIWFARLGGFVTTGFKRGMSEYESNMYRTDRLNSNA